MKISIIVAVYNGAKTLQACLNSISSQTYSDRELIIMDGGSTDGTVKILEENSQKISYWESSPDRGIFHAWNKALKHVTGDWVYFLGSDDAFHDRDVLNTFVSRLQNMTILPLVAYGKIEYCKGENRRLIGEDWERIRRKIYSGMFVPHQGMFHNKELFKLCGGFDERYQVAGDYLLLLQSTQYQQPLYLKDFVVADMQAGGKSSVRSMRWLVLNEYLMAQNQMHIPFHLRFSREFIFGYFASLIYRLFKIQ